jgi:hypothetical protein
MSELEFEKSTRGNQSPIANENAWGTSFINFFGQYTTGNYGQISESISTGFIAVKDHGNASFEFTDKYRVGPLRVGIFAANPGNIGTDNEKRVRSGATYTGIMEMSGNLNEYSVSIGVASSRTFLNQTGDGKLSFAGHANVSSWPGIVNGEITNNTAGILRKGGNLEFTYDFLRVSQRDGNSGNNDRQGYNGGRGVRSLK